MRSRPKASSEVISLYYIIILEPTAYSSVLLNPYTDPLRPRKTHLPHVVALKPSHNNPRLSSKQYLT